MIKLIICDWNRTLFEDRFEEVLFKIIFKDRVLDSIRRFDIRKLSILAKTRKECNILFGKARHDESHKYTLIRQIIDQLNNNVIKGLKVSDLRRITSKYTAGAVARLDKRILDPLKTTIDRSHIKVGILSSGYYDGISEILFKAGIKPDFIIANNFIIKNGVVEVFQLDILLNKLSVLKEVLAKHNIDLSETMYIGDDWQDEECFKSVGYPMVSFFADEHCKKNFAKIRKKQPLKSFIT